MKVVDGCIACAKMAYNFSELSFIYPITPSSTMASQIDLQANQGVKNIFDDDVKIVEMQSEAGAAGALHGALAAGSLASTFTASQGLLLMLPNMYKMAGEMLPAVIHVAARSLATHALSIFGDHQDVYAARATGFAMLASTNVQDAYNLALVSHLSAIESSIPFLHFFDGFRTSHELNQINELAPAEILKLVNKKKIEEFRARALNSGKSITRGTAQNEDIYFQGMEAKNLVYREIPDIVAASMEKVNKLTKNDYRPFNYYGSSKAKYVIVAMGSVCDTIKTTVNELNKASDDYGLIEVHLYRPFSKKYLEAVLPASVEKIAVLDRTKEQGSEGEPLYLDILSALKARKIEIVGGRYGLSSKNTTPNDIYDVFMMLKNELKNDFTVGITDDVTYTSLTHYDYELANNYHEFKIFGFGSDGMVSASKDILKILGKEQFVQGYFEYDSKKSGGITISHLRLAKKLIEAPYYVTEPELIVVSKPEYFHRFEMVANIKKDGCLLINTNKTEAELNDFLPTSVKKTLKERNIKVYTIDAEAIASQNGIGGKISLILESNILQLLGYDDFEKILTKNVTERFATKGADIVKANINCIKLSKKNLTKVKLDEQAGQTLTKAADIFAKINARMGCELTVKDLMAHKDGTFPGGTSANEKRKMSGIVPKWEKTNCTQCGLCALVCPHAVVRTFLLNKGNRYATLCKNAIEKDKDFYVAVSEADCTGCGLCAKMCPKNCFEFGQYDEDKQQIANDLFNNHENPIYPLNTIRGIEFRKPLFEFSGACAGCGETPYLKLLTQLFGEKLVIANATGCSSIYGASCPSTPYKVSWANSLFEDNAEFGFGILETYNKMQKRIEKVLQESKTKEAKDLEKKWHAAKDDYEQAKALKEMAKGIIPDDLIDYLTPKSVWTVGGDGWAYDIGFGGLDHVLSSGENVNILVLDTEVYSNTGGQASKSSRIGAVAEFANMGKKTHKKDLFKIAMTYPNVYVASICFGANMMQTIKAFKEAEAHQGPAIIIAYSPCVEQGIKGGMGNAFAQQKSAVDSGYILLMRYMEETLYLDSSAPDFTKYEDFLNNEVRYNALKIKNKKMADELLELNKQSAIKRYDYYKKLLNQE